MAPADDSLPAPLPAQVRVERLIEQLGSREYSQREKPARTGRIGRAGFRCVAGRPVARGHGGPQAGRVSGAQPSACRGSAKTTRPKFKRSCEATSGKASKNGNPTCNVWPDSPVVSHWNRSADWRVSRPRTIFPNEPPCWPWAIRCPTRRARVCPGRSGSTKRWGPADGPARNGSASMPATWKIPPWSAGLGSAVRGRGCGAAVATGQAPLGTPPRLSAVAG